VHSFTRQELSNDIKSTTITKVAMVCELSNNTKSITTTKVTMACEISMRQTNEANK
jgi:hypothetical protein